MNLPEICNGKEKINLLFGFYHISIKDGREKITRFGSPLEASINIDYNIPIVA